MENKWNEIFRQRTKTLAANVLKAYAGWKKNDEMRIVGKQLMRSCTSVAANYRAMCRARSDRERYAKLCIAVEEADETLFWLELLVDAELMPPLAIEHFYNEMEEILKVLVVYRTKLKQNIDYK